MSTGRKDGRVKSVKNGARQNSVMRALAWGPLTVSEIARTIECCDAVHVERCLYGLIRRGYVAVCRDMMNHRLTMKGVGYVERNMKDALKTEPEMRG